GVACGAPQLVVPLVVPGEELVVTGGVASHPGRDGLGGGILERLDAVAILTGECVQLGGAYHKLMRRRLQQLADRIQARVGEFGYRAFVDSAPVLERALAEQAGLGWIGKNTMLINRRAGSWFFLGELLTDLPLPLDEPATFHCGSCRACLGVCPTGAFVGPHELDARKCISYLTIESKSAIPEALRPLMGNRVFGCDDCQLVCPWNKFASFSPEEDFTPRHA